MHVHVHVRTFTCIIFGEVITGHIHVAFLEKHSYSTAHVPVLKSSHTRNYRCT